MRGLLRAAGEAFLAALILTPILRDIFRAYNVVDRPGRRKVHAYPIPRLGGIAIASAYAIALAFYSGADPAAGSDLPAWQVLPGAAVIFLTGILDDFFNLRPVYKLLGQVAAAALVFWSGLRIDTVAAVPLPLGLSLPLTVFWLLLSMNAFNLIDGLDGLCAGVAFLAAGTFFVAARIQGNFALEHATLPLAGALLGFLFYNFHPATMFLGDSGAMLIGLLLGCFGIVWTGQQTTLLSAAAPLLALSLPLIDLSVSVVRRFLRSRPIFSPDREHIHHRLLDLGLTPWRAVLTLYLAAASGGVFALLLIHPSLRKVQAFVIVGFCAAAWVGVERLRYNEFDVAGKLLFRGEFQRALKENVRIQELAAAFERCENEEVWWDRVATAVHDAGWTSATWIRNRSIHRERAFPSQPPAWRFRITLGEDEAVEIEGPLQPAGSSLDLMALAGAIHSSLAVGRSSWKRRALP